MKALTCSTAIIGLSLLGISASAQQNKSAKRLGNRKTATAAAPLDLSMRAITAAVSSFLMVVVRQVVRRLLRVLGPG